MITILLHTPELYKEIMTVVRQFTPIEYQDQTGLIDYYAQQFITIELRRRQFQIDDAQVRSWLYVQLWEHPLVTDYLTAHAINHHLSNEPRVWAAVEDEVSFSVIGEPWMWHIGGGIWKILTLGYEPCLNNTSLSTTTSLMLGH